MKVILRTYQNWERDLTTPSRAAWPAIKSLFHAEYRRVRTVKVVLLIRSRWRRRRTRTRTIQPQKRVWLWLDPPRIVNSWLCFAQSCWD